MSVRVKSLQKLPRLMIVKPFGKVDEHSHVLSAIIIFLGNNVDPSNPSQVE
jgi:hypothetical protein